MRYENILEEYGNGYWELGRNNRLAISHSNTKDESSTGNMSGTNANAKFASIRMIACVNYR